MKTSKIILLVLALLLAACGQSPNPPANLAATTAALQAGHPTGTVTPILAGQTAVPAIPTIIPAVSPYAAKYLNDALDFMQYNSINKHKIDWPSFRADILNQAAQAKTPAETYPFIKLALQGLDDHQSHFLSPQEASIQESGASPTALPPDMKLVGNKFGYVLVRDFTGLNQDLINRYGTDMQNQIQALDSQHPCGWIVDLRGNKGGNMWPILVGLGPILGEGRAGLFIDADGSQTEWVYANGKGLVSTRVISEVIGKPYHLNNPNAPVAVLFGGNTANSGQAIVISFVGRLNSRSFGSQSAGFTTGSSKFQLSDHAIIFLTTVNHADRNGKVYKEKIVPDVLTGGDNNVTGSIPGEALQWLNDQLACK